LLAINDIGFALTAAQDDRAEEVSVVLLDFMAFMVGLVVRREFGVQVIEQLFNVLLVPFVFTLILVDGIPTSLE
jgi:hypothetical protein